MHKSLKIVFVLGDGRSGSTLLDSILSSKENTVSIGEGFRFWERFYNANTKCSCDDLIQDCKFWGKVHGHLAATIPDYDPQKIKKLIKKYTFYKQSIAIEKGYQNEEIKFLSHLITEFYTAVMAANPDIEYIIDSSKAPGWAILISKIQGLDVKFIHLERDLTSVASSWKKKLELPEFVGEKKFMPIKSDRSIIRTWIRVKILSHKLAKNSNYFFLEYRALCNDPKALARLGHFLNWNLKAPFLSETTHAIAGNPSRIKGVEIKIRPYEVSKQHLSALQVFYFNYIYRVAKMLF